MNHTLLAAPDPLDREASFGSEMAQIPSAQKVLND